MKNGSNLQQSSGVLSASFVLRGDEGCVSRVRKAKPVKDVGTEEVLSAMCETTSGK